MLRRVQLPATVCGHLYLHSMPGKWESFARARAAIVDAGVSRVVCLTLPIEIRANAPEYAEAIVAGQLPWDHLEFPMPDQGVPPDRDGFWRLARDVAARLRSGERIMIHCQAGIGRTGTLAMCVLLALGLEYDAARARVRQADASPEAVQQEELVRWAASRTRTES